MRWDLQVLSTSKRATGKNASRRAVSLTELDRAILKQLSIDPLAGNRVVAEAIGAAPAQVAARIRWLDKQNVTRVIALLDLQATGQTFCFVQLVISGRALHEVAAEISQIRKALAVSSLSGGTSDLLVLLRFSNPKDLYELLFEGIAKIKGVYQFDVSTVVSVPVFRPEYVTYMPHFLPADIQANIQELALDYAENVIDGVDRFIIAELQQDGRKSISDIARRYDINASTIRYRVKNLESKGLLRFITVFDPSVIEIKAFALVEIVVSADRIDATLQHLSKVHHFRQLFLCAGSATIVSVIQADTIETIQRIKSEEISALEGIIKVKITPITHTYKLDLRWGQRFIE